MNTTTAPASSHRSTGRAVFMPLDEARRVRALGTGRMIGAGVLAAIVTALVFTGDNVHFGIQFPTVLEAVLDVLAVAVLGGNELVKHIAARVVLTRHSEQT